MGSCILVNGRVKCKNNHATLLYFEIFNNGDQGKLLSFLSCRFCCVIQKYAKFVLYIVATVERTKLEGYV